ncbi:MAG: transposase [Desulfobacteraceae bacterium]|nr:transposase [Desulfobacteraceae bacterium]MCF8093919.1 transposase [Desulfobacteraceae bacterium]
MVRQLRKDFCGVYYHILSRGNNRSYIFCSDKDRREFSYLLAAFSQHFAIEIYAYVLMDNHYHLLVRTLEPNLSKAMQRLGTAYTQRFNSRNSKSGHLFQGRFKSFLSATCWA